MNAKRLSVSLVVIATMITIAASGATAAQTAVAAPYKAYLPFVARVSTLAPLLTPTPPSPTATPTPTPLPSDGRVERLIALDKIYRDSGENIRAWLVAAGIECAVDIEARQPEEETVVDPEGVVYVVISGVQVRGNCSKVFWPAVLSTDRPGEVEFTETTRQYRPSQSNPSVLYTNVGLHGQATLWVDGTNWYQLWP